VIARPTQGIGLPTSSVYQANLPSGSRVAVASKASSSFVVRGNGRTSFVLLPLSRTAGVVPPLGLRLTKLAASCGGPSRVSGTLCVIDVRAPAVSTAVSVTRRQLISRPANCRSWSLPMSATRPSCTLRLARGCARWSAPRVSVAPVASPASSLKLLCWISVALS
jgi:hypothetical protein